MGLRGQGVGSGVKGCRVLGLGLRVWGVGLSLVAVREAPPAHVRREHRDAVLNNKRVSPSQSQLQYQLVK